MLSNFPFLLTLPKLNELPHVFPEYHRKDIVGTLKGSKLQHAHLSPSNSAL